MWPIFWTCFKDSIFSSYSSVKEMWLKQALNSLAKISHLPEQPIFLWFRSKRKIRILFLVFPEIPGRPMLPMFQTIRKDHLATISWQKLDLILITQIKMHASLKKCAKIILMYDAKIKSIIMIVLSVHEFWNFYSHAIIFDSLSRKLKTLFNEGRKNINKIVPSSCLLYLCGQV